MNHQDQDCHQDNRRLQEWQQIQQKKEIRTDWRRELQQPGRSWRGERGGGELKYF